MEFTIYLRQVTVIVVCVHVLKGISPPGPPNHVTVVSDVNNIGVQWEPPTESYGNIRSYIVSWSILPNLTEITNVVSGDITMSIISAQGQMGRLFKIRLRAENDGGVGPYSVSRFVRIPCGQEYDIFPERNVTVTSPGFQTHALLPFGVICSWTFRTLSKYSIEFYLEFLELDATDSIECTDSFLDITGIKRLCNVNNDSFKSIRTNKEEVSVTMKTGQEHTGHGFLLTVRSVVLLPGPPSNIHINTSDHAIFINWQPPRENTLPVTAFIIRYRVVSTVGLQEVTIGPNMRHFSINTDPFEGKLMAVNITAVIGTEEGHGSDTIIVRAPCRRRIYLDGTNSVNLTSPGYPRAYPSGIICVWYITTGKNVTSTITYLDFVLEDTVFCSSDYITFSFHDNTEHECSKLDAPKTIKTERTNYTLIFVADNVNEYKGFLIQIVSWVMFATPSIISSTSTSSSLITTSTASYTLSSSLALRSESNATTTYPASTTQAVTSASVSLSVMTTDRSITVTAVTAVENESLATEIPDHHNSTDGSKTIFMLVSTSVIPSYSSDGLSEQRFNVEAQTNLSKVDKPNAVIDQGEQTTSNLKFTVIVVVSVFIFFLLFGVAVCYLRWRQKHRTMKINSKKSGKHRVTRIEMHDIMNDPVPFGKYYKQNSNEKKFTGRHLETIHEHPDEHLSETSACRLRRRRYHSFPFCFSAKHRKIHSEVEKSLKSFDFIEDKIALRKVLERKHRVRRINSV